MKKCILLISVVVFSGCSLIDFGDASTRVKDGTGTTAAIVEGTTATVENVTGPLLSVDTAAKGESVAGNISNVAGKVETMAQAAAPFLPESPYKNIGLAVLGALTAVSGAAATWFRNRKEKAIQLSATIAEKTVGGGKVATAEATKLGLAEDLNAAYLIGIKNGVYSLK